MDAISRSLIILWLLTVSALAQNIRVNTITTTTGLTNNALTANRVLLANANKAIVSGPANATGALTNDGSGGFGYYDLTSISSAVAAHSNVWTFATSGNGSSNSPFRGIEAIIWSPYTSYDWGGYWYIVTNKLSLGFEGAKHFGNGATILNHGASLSNVVEFISTTTYTMHLIFRDFKIDGGTNASTAAINGLYVDSMNQGSSFDNIDVKNVRGAGAYINFSVLSEWQNFTVSGNSDYSGGLTPWIVKPTNGLVIVEGYACKFLNVAMERLPGMGIYAPGAFLCDITGTSEGNGGGIYLGNNNNHVSLDCEVNTTNDFYVVGNFNTFENCDSLTNTVVIGRGNVFLNCNLNIVDNRSTAEGTLLQCCVFITLTNGFIAQQISTFKGIDAQTNILTKPIAVRTLTDSHGFTVGGGVTDVLAIGYASGGVGYVYAPTLVLRTNVVIPTITAPSAGQVLTAVDTTGTVGWSNAPAGSGGGIATQDGLGTNTTLTTAKTITVTNLHLRGHTVWDTDNAFDLGASGATRPRDLFMGRRINIGSPDFSDSPLNIKTDGSGIGMKVTSSATEYMDIVAGGVMKGFRGFGTVDLALVNAGDVLLSPAGNEQLRISSSQLYVKSSAANFAGSMMVTGTVSQVSPNNVLNGTIFTSTGSVGVTNSVNETSLLGAGVGVSTLPANFLVAGRTIRVTVRGHFSDDAASPGTINIKVKLGSTIVCTTGAQTPAAAISAGGWKVTADITCRTTGGSGSVMGHGSFENQAAGLAENNWWMVNTTTTTIDTTASQAIDVTWTWGTADIDNSTTSHICTVEVLR